MTTDEFLLYLRRLDVRIWADGDRLRLDAPKEVLTPDLRAELAERKAEILGFLHEVAAVAHSSPGPIGPIPRDEDIPLSFAQQRLWFLDRLEPGDTSYNMPLALRLSGALDVGALQQALKAIVERHEALRTTFTLTDGGPVQVIAPALSFELPVEDLSDLAEGEREAEARRRAGEEARQPFDLERGPLLRTRLLRLGEQEHVLLLTVHHIVCDGWSMEVFWRELAALYGAFSEGEPSPLPELPIQYADFAVWQREWLQGEVLDEQLSYWKERLAGVPALELPTDRPRPAVQTHRGARQELVLPEPLSEALKEVGRGEGATLFMVLLAAFEALLSRYTGQEDVAVGTPIAGRNRPEVEGLIGFFVNTLVMRTDLSGDPTFRELLGRVREAALGAYEHQDVPFERLVKELQPQREMSRTPLFQALFQLLNAPRRQALELAGLTLSTVPAERETAKFDLTLEMFEGPEGLKGSFGYNTDLFDADTIARMAGHFQTLLEGIVRDPEQRLTELPILLPSERQQLLVEWNDTRTEHPENACVHELFEEQVERTPDAVAVAFEDQQLTYRELNRRANQLARYLRKLAVGPEVLVGLYVERSLEMAVGLLGILKAGGAYVPLDPAYPKERLSFMFEDAQVPVLLTQQWLVGDLPEHKAEVVCLDSEWEKIAEESDKNSVSGVTVENLAYVIYTSGSTGTPKGTMVTHRGLGNLAQAQFRAFVVQPDSRVLQFSPLSFDASVWEFFGTLLAGATLCLARQDDLRPGPELVGLLRQQAITTATLPPSVLATLPTERFPALRTIVSAGEACTAEVAARWSPGYRFLNAYGPSEATVCATITENLQELDTRPPPIGRPIANTEAYVLDAQLRPVPIGVPGELHIGGVGLARGYLNRPELTAEKFIPHPFRDEPGARLYKTGDLARYRSDGNIEFLGRLDQQVKVRGYRIEVGEIEAVLSRHPGVREAAVLARENEAGGKRLVAYVVSCREQPPATSELRGFLKKKLPEYMVPSLFVVLEALPLTPSGKVDRQALPASDGTRPELERAYLKPRTALEQYLVGIWQEILGVERVGIHDDFFELGGDSIRGAVLINRLQQVLDEMVYVVAIFEASTIAELAVYLNQHYPDAVARLWGTESPKGGEGRARTDNDPDAPSPRKALTPIQPVARRGAKATPEHLLANLDQLSDEEIDTLLVEVMDDGEETL